MVLTRNGEQNSLFDVLPSDMSLIKSSGSTSEMVFAKGVSSSRSKKSVMRCEIRLSPATDVYGCAGNLRVLSSRASASILATSVSGVLVVLISSRVESGFSVVPNFRKISSFSQSGREKMLAKKPL